MPLRNLTWLAFTCLVSLMCYSEANRNRYAGILSDSIDTISRYYVEPIEHQKLFEGGMQGMMDQLDPYSGFISADKYNSFRVEIEQHFGGIGIEVGMEDERLTVLNPVPGGPAFRAGMRAGDVIVSIDEQDVTAATIDDAVDLMRGPEGTDVVVGTQRPGTSETRVCTITRARITIDSVRGDRRDDEGLWSFRLESHPELGYLRLTSFGDRTTKEVVDALNTIDGDVAGLIMDLRGNAGGLLTAAVDICDLFIGDQKLVVSTRGRIPEVGDEYFSKAPPTVDPQLPVVVLVDRFTASAGEIFAACLQDYDRATIVGERTWGKGTVQEVIGIDGGRSAIRLTTQTYWRPSGVNIHRSSTATEDDEWGVTPLGDNLVQLTREELQAVMRRRRDRDFDILRSGEPDPPSSSQSEVEGEGSVQQGDRQLQRAVDVLLEKLPSATRAA